MADHVLIWYQLFLYNTNNLDNYIISRDCVVYSPMMQENGVQTTESQNGTLWHLA